MTNPKPLPTLHAPLSNYTPEARAELFRRFRDLRDVNEVASALGTPEQAREARDDLRVEWYDVTEFALSEHVRAEKAEAEAEKLRTALGWYADERNYDEDTSAPGHHHRNASTPAGPGDVYFVPDDGERARAALSTVEIQP